MKRIDDLLTKDYSKYLSSDGSVENEYVQILNYIRRVRNEKDDGEKNDKRVD